MSGRFPIGGAGGSGSSAKINVDNDSIMQDTEGVISVPTAKGMYRGTILIDTTVADGDVNAYQLTLCKSQPLVDGDVVIAQAISVSGDITEHQISEFQLDYVSTYTPIGQGSEQASITALSDDNPDSGISTTNVGDVDDGGTEDGTYEYSDITLKPGEEMSFILNAAMGTVTIDITFTHYGCAVTSVVNSEPNLVETFTANDGGDSVTSYTSTYTISVDVSTYDGNPIIFKSVSGNSNSGTINVTKIVVSGLYGPTISNVTYPEPESSSGDSEEETAYTFVQLSDVNVIKAPFVYNFVYLDGKLYGSAQSSTTLSNVPQDTVGAMWYE